MNHRYTGHTGFPQYAGQQQTIQPYQQIPAPYVDGRLYQSNAYSMQRLPEPSQGYPIPISYYQTMIPAFPNQQQPYQAPTFPQPAQQVYTVNPATQAYQRLAQPNYQNFQPPIQQQVPIQQQHQSTINQQPSYQAPVIQPQPVQQSGPPQSSYTTYQQQYQPPQSNQVSVSQQPPNDRRAKKMLIVIDPVTNQAIDIVSQKEPGVAATEPGFQECNLHAILHVDPQLANTTAVPEVLTQMTLTDNSTVTCPPDSAPSVGDQMSAQVFARARAVSSEDQQQQPAVVVRTDIDEGEPFVPIAVETEAFAELVGVASPVSISEHPSTAVAVDESVILSSVSPPMEEESTTGRPGELGTPDDLSDVEPASSKPESAQCSEDERDNYGFRSEPHESQAALNKRKMQYDRNFLLKLKNSVLALQKPPGLPSDFPDSIIFDKPHGFSFDFRESPDFTPDFAKYPATRTPGKMMGPSPRAFNAGRTQHKALPDSRRPSRPVGAARVVPVPDREKPELKRSATGYVPNFLREAHTINGEEGTELKRKIICILNRITPQNFADCLNDLVVLNIGDEMGLTILINTIFEKAVKEEAYSVTFAQICSSLANLKVDLHEGNVISFKGLLLKRCQEMFETPLQIQLDNVATLWDQKVASEADEKMKKMFVDEKDEQIKKAKDKFYGNIRFIGELFLKQILSAKIIHRCIRDLLISKEPESLESLCKLLETCGATLDTAQAQQWMNSYFSEIEKLTRNDKVECRLRYKLMDVMEMRERGWKLRKIQEQRQVRPMTKEELAEEDRRKQIEKDQELMKAAANARRQGSLPNPAPVDRRRPPPVLKPKATVIDPKDLVLSSKENQSDEFKLAPTRSWIGGSGCKPQTKQSDSDGWKSVPSNSRNQGRSQTQSIPQQQQPQAQQQSSREASRSRDASPPSVPPGLAVNTVAGRSMGRSTPPISSPAVGCSQGPAPDAGISSAVVSVRSGPVARSEDGDEKIKKRAVHLITEFINSDSVDEEVARKVDHMCVLVDCLLNLMMDADRAYREKCGLLFDNLMAMSLLNSADFISGMQSYLELAEDILIDVPELWRFLAESLQMLIQPESNISYFTDALKPIEGFDDAPGKILSSCLHMASNRLGHEAVGRVFSLSGLDWSNFLPPGSNVSGFVAAQHLEFTLEGGSPMSPETGGISLDDLEQQLQDLLKDSDNEQVFDLLEQQVDRKTASSPLFIRLIYRVIVNNAIDPRTLLIDEGSMNGRCPILKRIVDHKQELELQALYGIQQLYTTLRSRGAQLTQLMTSVFESLLHQRIISQDAFLHWRSLSNPEVSENHRELLLDTTDFFVVFNR